MTTEQAGSPFTYLFCDLVTGTPLLELPLSGVSFGDSLNGIGQFSGTLQVKDARVQAQDWNNATLPTRTMLVILLNQTIVWSGIIWQRNYDSTKDVTLSGSTLWSIWGRRLQQVDHATTWNGAAGGDPCVIAQTMMVEAQAASVGAGAQIVGTAGNTPPGVPVSIIGGPTPPGEWVTQAYPLSSQPTIDSIVSNLANLGYGVGFDYRMGLVPAGNGFAPYVNLYYPRAGVVGSLSGLVFDVSNGGGGKWTYPEDGTKSQNRLIVTSSRSGGVQGDTSTAVTREGGYPLLESTLSISGLHTKAAALKVAQGILAVSGYPVTAPTCTTFADEDPVLGSFSVGDDAQFVVPAMAGGMPFDARFPAGMQTTLRIIDWSVTVPDGGGRATCVTTFNLPPSTSVQMPPI